MDLQTIAQRTGLSLRKLRYVFDHRLLPGLRVRHDSDVVGHPRSLTPLEALGIACAAALVEGGARRETVMALLDALVDTKLPTGGGRQLTALEWAHRPEVKPAVAFLGDGTRVRLQIGKHDTNWFEADGAKTRAKSAPRVVIQVDLAGLREDLQR